MAEELLQSDLVDKLAKFTMVPSGGGVFEIARDGELIYSKKQLRRFPEPGEVTRLLQG